RSHAISRISRRPADSAAGRRSRARGLACASAYPPEGGHKKILKVAGTSAPSGRLIVRRRVVCPPAPQPLTHPANRPWPLRECRGLLLGFWGGIGELIRFPPFD